MWVAGFEASYRAIRHDIGSAAQKARGFNRVMGCKDRRTLPRIWLLQGARKGYRVGNSFNPRIID